MDEEKHLKKNYLKKAIEQAIRRTGFDESFIHAVKFHLSVYVSKSEDLRSKDDYCDLIMSTLFLNQMDMYPTQRFKCQVNEHSDWPLPVLPSEVFGDTKLSCEYRKRLFYKCLQIGDLLDCRVASVLPMVYHLRVIHKYGATRILDDLNIIVVMPRSSSELSVLKEELLPCDLIRVSVSQISNGVYVTVSNNTGELDERKRLGKIPEEHLPAYVLDVPDYSCSYSAYLSNLRGLKNPLLLNNILEGFGINPRGVYSSYPICGSMKPIDGNALLKEVNWSHVNHLSDLSLKERDNKNFHLALDYVEKAIKFYPTENLTAEEKINLSILYEMRGTVYFEMDKCKISKNTISDWQLAAKMNPSGYHCEKKASYIAFLISNRLYRNKDYREAVKFVKLSSKIDKDNVKALELLRHLELKHPDVFEDAEEESLLSLQEKKKEIVSELKKETSLSEMDNLDFIRSLKID